VLLFVFVLVIYTISTTFRTDGFHVWFYKQDHTASHFPKCLRF
jgi:hypothetical protein